MATRWWRARLPGLLRSGPKELESEEEAAARLEQQRRARAARLSRVRRLMEPSGPPERLLSRRDMEQMRYLRQNFPEEWPISRLARSFEVSPDIITRVLKSRFSPSLQRAQKQDSQLQAQRSGGSSGSLLAPEPAGQALPTIWARTRALAPEAAQRKRASHSAPQPSRSPPQRHNAEPPTEDEQPQLQVVRKGREFVDQNGNLLYRIPT